MRFFCFFYERDSFIFLFLEHFFGFFFFSKKISFHFCFDIPQMSVCNESDSFHFYFLFFFFKWGLFGVFSFGFGFCLSTNVSFLRKHVRGGLRDLFILGVGAALLFLKVGPLCVRFCLCFLLFSCFLGLLFCALGAGRRAAFFQSGFFVCVFVCVFSFFSGFFWVPCWLWVLGAVLLFVPSGFVCAKLFVFWVFCESGSFIFFNFGPFFGLFKRKISFHFCFDLPQMSVC